MIAAALGGVLLALALPPLALPPLAALGVGGVVWGLHRARTLQEAAGAGALFAGLASALALHWAPAAAEPWLGVGGAVAAGLSIWLLHAACGALALAMAWVLRDDLPLALRGGAAFGVLEWLPGALPLVGIPWFPVAASLDGWPALLPLVAVVGSGGVGALLAVSWGAVLPLLPLRRGGRGRARPLPGLLLAGGSWGAVIVGWALLPPIPGEAEADATLSPGATLPLSPPRVAALSLQRPRGEVAEVALLRERLMARMDDGLEPPEAWGELRLLFPEAPLPRTAAEDSVALAWLQAVDGAGRRAGGGSVAGAHAEVGGRRYNTLVRLGPGDDPPEGVHRKRFLVPGVERTSFFTPGRPGRGLAPGAGALPFGWEGIRAGALICFEILYPTEAARLRRRGATLLLQSTNDAMLQPGGRLPVVAAAGRRQHEAMVRLRAAEFRVPVVRSALAGRAFGVGADGVELTPFAEADLPPSPEGGEGSWAAFRVPAAGPPPPAAWSAPLLGPFLLGLLGVPLVFVWRRGRLLAPSGSVSG